MRETVFESHSESDTYNFAKKTAADIEAGTIICMYGDLGAGKTVFVKGIADGLGIKEYITSPTFTIMNKYDARLTLYHFDLYRISDSEELYQIGFDECLESDGVCIIEWAELAEDVIPKTGYDVIITKDENDFDYRRIEIRKRR